MRDARRLFMHQRRTAKYRGIDFLFTFEDWIDWWKNNLGANWIKKRGCYANQFVMARKGDKGPYAAWNVECITARENAQRRKLYGTTPRGEQQGLTKLTAAMVKQIWFAVGTTVEIEKQLGVNRHTVQNIKSGRCWGHVTSQLKPGYRKRNKRLTPEEVIEIFNAPGSAGSISRRFDVNYALVWGIKHRKIWIKATQGLGKPPLQKWSRV